MQLVNMVCILQNIIQYRIPPKILIIQPLFTLTFSIPDCGLLCLLSCVLIIRVEHTFFIYSWYVSKVLFFSLPIMVQIALTCFDLQKVCRTRNTWVYTDLDLWCLSQWVHTMLCLHGNECNIFQQRVSCIINQDLCVVVTYCLFTSCSGLDKPRHGTDFSQLCFEYGVSSLNSVYLHAECYRQLRIIVYLMLGPS